MRLSSGRRLSKTGVWDTEAPIEYVVSEEEAERITIATLPETPDEPLLPVATPAAGDGDAAQTVAVRSTPIPAGPDAADSGEGEGLTFDDPTMDWSREEDPFANLGPVDPEGTDDPKPRGSGGPLRRR